ncbi:MAG: methionine sulfoxide reductase [Armatimonadetes bacterium CG2_30_66_41]|nr:MAG: methionine sulfoxide reductase [Armatimonadetes bacterium CG2_30_66_41]
MTAKPDATNYRKLTPEEEYILVRKGTEPPFSGEYDDHFATGVYTCRRCGAMLYRSKDKFRSHCGWPAFDDEIPGAVRRHQDADGRRTEILCAHCGGHLGHVFEGERLTAKNTRHCVNSLSLLFVPAEKVKDGRAIFTAGCFWGVAYWMQRQPGVVETTAGYTGGTTERPTHEEVAGHRSGHVEAVEVRFDPVRTSFEDLAKLFFETHDPTGPAAQAPSPRTPSRSAIFVVDEGQKRTAEKLIAELKARGLNVVTTVAPAGRVWPAEEVHQDYYAKSGGQPPCRVRKRLWAPAHAETGDPK